MKKIYSKVLLLSLTIILLIVMIIGYSLAWFDQITILTPSITSEDLVIDSDVYFISSQNPDIKVYPSFENHLISNKNLLIIDVVNTESINYIDNLHVDLKVRGTIDSYIRIKLFEEFYKYNIITKIDPITKEEEIVEIGGIEKQPILSYNIFQETNWFDNRASDGFLYYKNKVSINKVEEDTKIPLIRGIKNIDDVFPLEVNITPTSIEGYTVSWSFKVEIVQATRVKQIWNFNKLPWE